MKLTYKTIDDFLREVPAHIKGVLVYGPDEGQVRERINIISKQIIPDLSSNPFNLIETTASKISETNSLLSDEMNAFSLMGGAKIVKIQNDKNIASIIEHTMHEYSGDNFLIVEADNLTPASSIRKLFEDKKNLAALPCYIQDEKSLTYDIPKKLAQYGKKTDIDSIRYLSSCLVGDSGNINNELEKLALYVGNQENITIKDCLACIKDSSEIAMEKIPQKAALGNFDELDKELQKTLNEGISEVAVLRISQTYFKKLLFIKKQIEDGIFAETALKTLRPPLFFKDKPIFESALQKWNTKNLLNAQKRLIHAEILCKKTGYPNDSICSNTLHIIARMAKK